MARLAFVIGVNSVAIFAKCATNRVVGALAVLAAAGFAVEAVFVGLLAVVAVPDGVECITEVTYFASVAVKPRRKTSRAP